MYVSLPAFWEPRGRRGPRDLTVQNADFTRSPVSAACGVPAVSLLSVWIASGPAFSPRAGQAAQVWQDLWGSHYSWHRFLACLLSAHLRHVQSRGDRFPSLPRVPCCGRFSSLWTEALALSPLLNSFPLIRLPFSFPECRWHFFLSAGIFVPVPSLSFWV